MAHPKFQICAATTLQVLFIIILSLLYIEYRNRHDLTFSWVPPSDPVAMFIGEGSHYDLFSDQGTQEYAKLLPSGGHTVHPAGSEKPYTVTLFHQLKCLNILRNEHNFPDSEPLTHHCLTYLRQTILCRPNLRIESVQTPVGSASRGYDTVCPRDWNQLYEAAKDNQNKYATKTARRQ